MRCTWHCYITHVLAEDACSAQKWLSCLVISCVYVGMEGEHVVCPTSCASCPKVGMLGVGRARTHVGWGVGSSIKAYTYTALLGAMLIGSIAY